MIYNPRKVARKPVCPCYECPDRFAGCHSTCGLYAEYKAKIAEEKTAASAAYAPLWMANDYEVKEKRKNSRKKEVER